MILRYVGSPHPCVHAIVDVYGKLVSNFMGHAYTKVLQAIWRAHPEWRPAEINDIVLRRGRRTAIRALLLFGACLAVEIADAGPAITKYGERNARAPKELDVFAFLVGHWEGSGRTRLQDGTFADFSASWIGRYILDGMAIADEFHSSAPDGSPYMGISLRQYEPRKKIWIVEYLNVSGSFLRRQVNAGSGSVKTDGQAIVVTSESQDTWSRETYRVISHNQFTYSIDVSSDSGRNWSLGQIEMQFLRTE